MKKNKLKKLFISLMVFVQVFSLTAGNFFVARAGITDNITDGITDAVTEPLITSVLDSILRSLGIQNSTAKDAGSTSNVAQRKSSASIPTVSVMFSPSNPKVGEKATANAVAMGFSNDREKIYYTWFIKRKGCDIKPDPYNPSTHYGSKYLDDKLKEGDTRTEKECDVDGDNLITVNDWKVEAARMIVQNGFLPDTGGRYESLDDFYTIHEDEKEDADGYQAWQGGGDNERMTARCYVYNPSTGFEENIIDYFSSAFPYHDPEICDGSIANKENQFHLFPQRLTDENGKVNTNFYKHTRDYANSDAFMYKEGNNTGNDNFGLKDEQFWGTDPRNASTSGSGQPDEAVLTGMGIDKFTWEYETGDEVGVAVEGVSTIATKFADSSRMIMWAFSKGIKTLPSGHGERLDLGGVACMPRHLGGHYYACADTECTTFRQISSMPGTFPVTLFPSQGMRSVTNYAFFDFEECVEFSTLPITAGSSLTGSQPTGMEVTLSANPANPLNDETGEGGGDTVNVQAMISGASGSESDLNYTWKIQAFKPTTEITNPTDRDWTNNAIVICGKGETESCPLVTEKDTKLKTNGLGLKSINFKLNLKSTDATYKKVFNKETGVGYFRISLEARESAEESSDPNSRVGRGDVVVKINSTKNQIEAFLAEASGTKLVYDEKICTEGQEKIVCPVVKNQIIALEAPKDTKTEELTDFTWFLDGKPINTCDKELSDKCENNKSTRTTFIPITDSGDENFTVSVKASNIAGTGTGTGKKVELSRKFKRVEPSIKIVPDGGGVHTKVLGKIVDPTDKSKQVEDSSESILETTAGADVKLKLKYVPENISSSISEKEEWQVDGEKVKEPQFKAGLVGTVHNASASVVYSQPKALYAVLKLKFGISISEMKDQTLSSSVQIEVNEEIVASGIQKTTRFMANLLEKIPQQLLFMLRLILSVGVTLVLVGGIFAFFPETAYDERRR